MLTWDEEVTSALAHTAYAGLQQHRVVDAPPPASATAVSTHRTAASPTGPAHAATESRAHRAHALPQIIESLGQDEVEFFDACHGALSVRDKTEFLVPFIDTNTAPIFHIGVAAQYPYILRGSGARSWN